MKQTNLIKKENKFEHYLKIENSLNQLYETLEKNGLNNESDCLILTEPYILYITQMNCNLYSFGHIDCIYYLINLIEELIQCKTNQLYGEITLNEYTIKLNDFLEKFEEFVCFFEENIFIETDKYKDTISSLDDTIRENLCT